MVDRFLLLSAAMSALLLPASACTISSVVFVDELDGGLPQADAGPDAGPDVTPPETTITIAPDGVSGDPNPTIEFVADEPAIFWCMRFPEDDQPFECSSPFAIGMSFEPWHIFSVRAVDLAGNVDLSPAEAVWRLDRVPPTVGVIPLPAEVDNDTSVVLRFFTAEFVVPPYECSYDGAPFSTCTSPWPLSSLAAGDHEFSVRARDAAGNLGDTFSYDWTVDPSTPNTVISSGPSGDVAADAGTFTFSSPNAGKGASFECSLDAAVFASCTSPQTYMSLSEGRHIFSVRVRNASNVADPSPAERLWNVDLTVPDFGLSSTHDYSEYSSRFFEAQIFDEGGTFGRQEFECSLDGVAAAPCPGPYAFVLKNQALGPHALTVVVTDSVGNRSAPVVHDWTVDTVPPDTVIESGPEPSTTTALAVFDFSASEEVSGYQCKLDDGVFEACPDPFSVEVVEGTHTLVVRARDRATNPDLAPASYTWTLTAP